MRTLDTGPARDIRGSRLRALLDLPSPAAAVSVDGLSENYRAPQVLGSHAHAEGQLVYAMTGVIVVGSEQGYWVVPPTRALWLAPGARHWARISANVQLRSVFLSDPSKTLLPDQSCVMNVSALMREVVVALAIRPRGVAMSPRDTALTTLLLHELHEIPVLPLHLPSPKDRRLLRIERQVLGRPASRVSLAAWAQKLGIDQRTLHRLFVKETGMPYRRWLQQAHLLLALEWLADGRRVIDVAAGLGYRSQSAFTVMFKRNLGMPPAMFFASSATPVDT